MKKIHILFLILIFIGIASLTIYREGTLPVQKNTDEEISFVIEPGENLDTIINNLSKNDLIRSRLAFYLVVKQLGIEREIQAGQYQLKQSMSASEIASKLTVGRSDTEVTVPEGLRKEEIAEIMSNKFGISETEFNQLAKEGHLFPETYQISSNPTAEQIIEVMENTFDQRYTTDITAAAEANKLSKDEVVVLASIVEREAKYPEDRSEIASILLRRYREDHPLQIDATVQYALGYQANEKRWWKSITTFADLEYDSPYNTYKNTGLPPAPICNPGIAAIKAVVNANENTPYQFYLSDDAGHTYYSKTYEEHQAKIEKYL